MTKELKYRSLINVKITIKDYMNCFNVSYSTAFRQRKKDIQYLHDIGLVSPVIRFSQFIFIYNFVPDFLEKYVIRY